LARATSAAATHELAAADGAGQIMAPAIASNAELVHGNITRDIVLMLPDCDAVPLARRAI